MKKQIVLSALLLSAAFISAQSPFAIIEGENAVVYSLPKTELCIEVQLEKTTLKPGPFYRYSERFLATNKVITEEKTTYTLKNVSVTTRAVPDANRTYAIIPNENLSASRITVNSQGILCGVNVRTEQEPSVLSAESKAEPNSESALLPLGEEYMMAGSEAKLAEGAAKQIYRIRERRLSLLTADVEKLPADGSSFGVMMDGLTTTEKRLNELFVGKKTVEVVSQKLYLTPSAAISKEVVFRLSALKGIVPTDDLSGTPYYISISPVALPTSESDPKAKKDKVSLYTVVPSPTQVSVGDGVNTFFTAQFFIPQFGKLVALPESLLKQANAKVRIDSQTGRVLSIE